MTNVVVDTGVCDICGQFHKFAGTLMLVHFAIFQKNRNVTTGSGSGLMPPPKSKPAATTQVPGPVPDPKSVKELFQLREKTAARMNTKKEGSKSGTVNSQDTSGYSADSGTKNSENVLPKIKPRPHSAENLQSNSC
jgi:hypothetical protein